MLVNAIWDLDGTLYDTYPVMMAALHDVLQEAGLTIAPAALLREAKETSVFAIAGRVAPALGTTRDQLLATYHDREKQRLLEAEPYPETAAVLQAIIKAGGNNLLMTHRDDSAWALLAKDDLRELFLGGVTARLQLPRKPDPAAINYLLARHQLNPVVTAMIGDRRLDVLAGQRAGVQTIYFNVDGLNDAPMATYQVEHLHEIPAFFQ
ncbi:HAD hydrolase-like protein [Lacticaseibacillus yichunensis]|uniref:HAD hydrolase-like protein n=1 Tax=Lacticaseibacillus yichunensis TaxID=2486015 RepID=A0ABW4CP83_9LACO|nr:HAD hydrolase-like protein [Lacticaseibacillus yichunensis]